MSVQRINEIIELLQAFALGEIDLPRERLAASDRVPPRPLAE